MAPRGDMPASAFSAFHTAPTPVRLEPFIVPGFLSLAECHRLRALADSAGLKRARLSGGVTENAVRSAQSGWFDEDQAPWFADRLVRAVSDISQNQFCYQLDGFEEGFQLLRYDGAEPGDGRSGDFYDWHVDIGGSGSTVSRKLSLVIQLSDPADYEGGRLEANWAGTATPLSNTMGTLIAFPSFVLHRVGPVTSGTRYSLAAWVHGPAFR